MPQDQDLAKIQQQRIFASSPIRLNYEGLYGVYDDGQNVIITILSSGDPDPVYRALQEKDGSGIIVLPRSLFSSDEQLMEWCESVHTDFQRLWHKVMVVETEQHFRDAANFHLGQMGIVPIDLPTVVRAHQDFIEDELKARFQLPKNTPIRRRRGQFSKWTEAEILTEVRAILNILLPGKHNYDEVNRVLTERHPNRPIKSGESLRKLLSSYGYTLTKIKRLNRKAESE